MARTIIRQWFPVALPESHMFFVRFSSYMLQTSKRCIRKVPWIRIWIPAKTCYRLYKGKWKKESKSLLPGYALLSFEKKIDDDWSSIERQLGVTFVRSVSGKVKAFTQEVVTHLENEEKVELWDVANLPTKIGIKVKVSVDAKNYPCAGQICVFMGVKEIDGGYFASVFFEKRSIDIPLDFLGPVNNEC